MDGRLPHLSIPVNSPALGWGGPNIVGMSALDQPIDFSSERHMHYNFSDSTLVVSIKATEICPQDIDALLLFSKHYMGSEAELQYQQPNKLQLRLPDTHSMLHAIDVYDLIGQCYETIKRCGLRYPSSLMRLYVKESFIHKISKRSDVQFDLPDNASEKWELAPNIVKQLDIL